MTKQEEKQKPQPNLEKLLGKEKYELYLFVKDRIKRLQQARQQLYGINLEKIWAQADKDYIPHTLKTKGKKVIYTDEEQGWRGVPTVLEKTGDWQSDTSYPNPYIKIQTALSILIDRNPEAVFTPGAKQYEQNNLLIKTLYQRNWEIAKSKQQLKLFIFNLAKYGWAIARTYPKFIKRKVKILKEYNEENPEKSVYEEKEVVEYNDIFRENLDVWNAWIDDMALPNRPDTIRDWAWRKVYPWDVFLQEFGNYPLTKYVSKGGETEEKIGIGIKRRFQEKDLVEVYFYENKVKDVYMVIANNIPIVIEPLPISDNEGRKKLSCWQAYWTLRNANCPYGIGIYEAIRNDQKLLDRIRNMTIDQLTLSIYKMFFHTGTSELTEGGEIAIEPGVGKQLLDPTSMRWLEVPGPGAEAWAGIEMFKKDIEEISGITPPLMGEITGKTAFEIAQAKEAALKRLKTPLENIADALEEDGYITVSLMQMLYSIPEVYKIVDKEKINAYLQEIQSDPELYEYDEEGNFYAKVYREFPMNLEKDEQGNFIESEDTRFFRIKPRGLIWEGIIKIKPQSILSVSKELQKAMDLEMINLLVPLLERVGQEIAIAQQSGIGISLNDTVHGKVIKNLLKIYDKDPKDWLPDGWLVKGEIKPPLILPRGETQAEKVVPTTELDQKPRNVVQKMVNKIKEVVPFR